MVGWLAGRLAAYFWKCFTLPLHLPGALLVGWLAGWLGGAKAEGIRVGEGKALGLGPWVETYGRGGRGNRHPWQLLGGLLLC